MNEPDQGKWTPAAPGRNGIGAGPGFLPGIFVPPRWARKKWRRILLGLGFVSILLIGLLDYFTGPQLSSSLFYLLPVLFITQVAGHRPGIAAATLATLLWFWADVLPPSEFSNIWIPVWNAAMRFGVFLIVVWLLASMRSLAGTLERRVEQRTEQLRKESNERRDLEKRILEISEREQARIGQDLHDGLCQHLVGTAFTANLLRQALGQRGIPEAAEASKIARLLDESITQARQLARGLYPVRIEDLGLVTALEELAEGVGRIFHLECGVEAASEIPPLDQSVAVHLYRIAQEAVANAAKHARARRLAIFLNPAPGGVELAIEDDGCGIAAGYERSAGLGLRIMEFRARIIGAAFRIDSLPGGGTRVTCLLPCPGTEDVSDGSL